MEWIFMKGSTIAVFKYTRRLGRLSYKVSYKCNILSLTATFNPMIHQSVVATPPLPQLATTL